MRTGEAYLSAVDRMDSGCWRFMVKIPDASTFKSLSEIPDHDERLHYASEAGRGLALFGDLTSTVDASRLVNPLPGYRNSLNYFQQFKSLLAGNRTQEQAEKLMPADPVVRESTKMHFIVHLSDPSYRSRLADPDLAEFIKLARDEREFGLTFSRELDSGAIRTVAVHGDTKLDNFLFSTSTRNVKSLVDLDTIMPHTWLSDWGDMARSLVNVAGEKEPDLTRIQVTKRSIGRSRWDF